MNSKWFTVLSALVLCTVSALSLAKDVDEDDYINDPDPDIKGPACPAEFGYIASSEDLTRIEKNFAKRKVFQKSECKQLKGTELTESKLFQLMVPAIANAAVIFKCNSPHRRTFQVASKLSINLSKSGEIKYLLAAGCSGGCVPKECPDGFYRCKHSDDEFCERKCP